jgi:tetratricopeptide (TPR) repeat protein
MKKHRLIIFLLVTISTILAGEETISQKIAALEHQLQKVQGEEQIDVLLEVGFLYHSTSPQKCIDCGKKALELSRKFKDLRKQARAMTIIGVGYTQLGDYENAAASLEDGLALFQKIGDAKGSTGVQVNLGRVYRRTGRYEKALECYRDALKYVEASGDKQNIAIVAGNMGTVYFNLNNTTKSLEYQLKALTISEEIGDKEGILHANNNIGLTYNSMGKSEKALEYFREALKVAKETGNKYVMTSALNHIGNIYRSKVKDYAKALSYFQEALDIAEEMGNKRFIAVLLDNMGTTHQNLDNFETALQLHRQSLALSEKIGDKASMANSLINMASLYNKMENFDNAITSLEQALKIADDIGAKHQKQISYLDLSILYENKGDYKTALEYHQLYSEINREIFSETNSKKIAELQTRYDTLKKEKKIETLEKNNLLLEKDNQLQRTRRNLFFVGFLLAALTAGLLVKKFIYLFSFWKKQKYIGHYRLLEEIGHGGIARVYKAHSVRDKTDTVALKILKDEYYDDDDYRERFLREAAIIEKLDHPNIVNIRERGVSSRKLFITMEFLQGITLRQKIDNEGKIVLHHCFFIMKQTTEAIAYIYGRHILHRDLKPGNIMLIQQGDRENVVKLLDFGLAKGKHQTRITGTGVLLGTISYMSPEQLTGQEYSFPADIFSLGVIFYEIVTGVTPFPGETPPDIMVRILEKTPVQPGELRPELPKESNTLIMNMLRKKPGERPTVDTVVEHLRKVSL